MKMQQTDDKTTDLDRLFADARQDEIPVPQALMARVIADGRRVQPVPPRDREPFWHGILEAIGGWPALGGLAAASCAGVWIGLNPPSGLADPAVMFFGTGSSGYEEAAEFSGFGWDMQEG